MNKGTLVQDHVCPSCGGVLSVDLKRQMYECPFCGVTFDYDYFREDEVLDLAKSAVTAGELKSAKQAYEFMLTKEPDNFEALRGMALITMRTANVNSLAQMTRYSKFNCGKTFEAVNRAIEDSKPEHREYFKIMKNIVRSGNEYANKEKLLEEERTKRKRANSLLDHSRRLRDDLNLSFNSEKQSALPPIQAIVMAVICVIIFWAFVGSFYSGVHSNPYSEARYYQNSSNTVATTNSVRSYVGSSGQRIDVGSGVSNERVVRSVIAAQRSNSASQEEIEKKDAAYKEQTRLEKYNEWENAHKGDKKYLHIALVIPVVLFAIFALWLAKRQHGFNKEIDDLEEVIRIHTNNINEYEFEMNELKKKVNEDLMRMKKIDPLTT